jgi:hypothetical protein
VWQGGAGGYWNCPLSSGGHCSKSRWFASFWEHRGDYYDCGAIMEDSSSRQFDLPTRILLWKCCSMCHGEAGVTNNTMPSPFLYLLTNGKITFPPTGDQRHDTALARLRIWLNINAKISRSLAGAILRHLQTDIPTRAPPTPVSLHPHAAT